jgi:hypothetical protein
MVIAVNAATVTCTLLRQYKMSDDLGKEFCQQAREVPSFLTMGMFLWAGVANHISLNIQKTGHPTCKVNSELRTSQ